MVPKVMVILELQKINVVISGIQLKKDPNFINFVLLSGTGSFWHYFLLFYPNADRIKVLSHYCNL
jgi:hypothetical protein